MENSGLKVNFQCIQITLMFHIFGAMKMADFEHPFSIDPILITVSMSVSITVLITMLIMVSIFHHWC